VAGFIISALGGSCFQIGDPTGAFVVIVARIIAKFGMSGPLMVTLMAGVVLTVLGATGLGAAVQFIPRPVTIGFTNGIAVLIASTQIKDFLGLTTGAVPSEFIGPYALAGRSRRHHQLAHTWSLTRRHRLLAKDHMSHPRFDSCPFFCHARRGVPGATRLDHWRQIRRYPNCLSAVLDSDTSTGIDSSFTSFGIHRGFARCSREFFQKWSPIA